VGRLGAVSSQAQLVRRRLAVNMPPPQFPAARSWYLHIHVEVLNVLILGEAYIGDDAAGGGD
jgi:hypothetical protein